jgi:hypothetical protein
MPMSRLAALMDDRIPWFAGAEIKLQMHDCPGKTAPYGGTIR